MAVTVVSDTAFSLFFLILWIEQSEGTASSSSSTISSVMKTSGQQQACVSQATMGTCKAAAPSVISATSLVSTPNPISGKATVSGQLYRNDVIFFLPWARIFLEGLKQYDV